MKLSIVHPWLWNGLLNLSKSIRSFEGQAHFEKWQANLQIGFVNSIKPSQMQIQTSNRGEGARRKSEEAGSWLARCRSGFAGSPA